MYKSIKIALICTLLMSVAGVQAATITVMPNDSTIGMHDVITVTVVGRDFLAGSEGSVGGGFSLLWNPAVVTLQSYLVTFPGTVRLGADGVLSAGSLMNEDVAHLSGAAGPDFDVAEFVFLAVGVGESLLDLAIGHFPDGRPMVWLDSAGLVDANPQFVDGRIVVTPIPAAIWLFGSVIGIAAWIRRRRGQVA
jgi:hypothetical protein